MLTLNWMGRFDEIASGPLPKYHGQFKSALSCVGRLFSVHFTPSGLIEAIHGDKLYGALGDGMTLSGGGGQTKNNSWQRIRIERSKKDDYCVVVWPTRNAIITMTTKRIPVQSSRTFLVDGRVQGNLLSE